MPSEFSPFHFQPGNPFLADFAPAEPLPGEGSVPLHPAALEDLEQVLHWARLEPPEAAGRGQGQAVLLRAPRAGFGKSHLLARLRGRAEAGESWVARVYFDPDNGVGWRAALTQVLEDWHRPAAAGADASAGTGAGLESASVLDLLARRIFSVMTAWLIRTGQVPSADAGRTAAEVERGFVEMFDFAASGGQPMAGWFQENFEMLLTAALPQLRTLTGLPDAGLRSWLRSLCGYAQGGAEQDPRRLATLQWALRQPVVEEQGLGWRAAGPAAAYEGGGAVPPGFGGGIGSAAAAGGTAGSQWLTAVPEDESFYRKMLTGLCRLAAVCRPLVVMLDHLDGFYANSTGLLKLGRLLSDWRQLSGRTVLVLSVNEDLWANGFQKALPSALEDRLNGWEVSLGGISLPEAEALVRSRLAESRVPPTVAAGFWASLNLPGMARTGEFGNQPLSPRAVLRHAARQWHEYWRPAAGSGQIPAPGAASMAAGMPMPGNIPPSNPHPQPAGYGLPAPFPLPPPSPLAWSVPVPAPASAAPPFSTFSIPPTQAPQPPISWPPPQQNAWPQPAAWTPPTAPLPAPPQPAWAPPVPPQSAWPLPMPAQPVWPPPSQSSWPVPGPPPLASRPQADWAPPPFHGHAFHGNPASGYPEMPSPGPGFQPQPYAPWPSPAAPSKTESRQPAIAPRFRELRDYFLTAHPPQPDQDRLSRLVKASGLGLQAVVRYEEFPLPGGSGRKVAVWQSPDGEILFGTEPHDDRAYWTTLLAFARQRAHLGIRVRLVVFSAAAAPVNLTAWLPQDEIVAARARFLDVLTLDRAETATLHAADQILHEAACGMLPVSPAEAFAAMELYLDFWWKRLMRPLTPLAGGAGGW